MAACGLEDWLPVKIKHPSCRIVAMHVVLHMSVCLSVTLTNDHIHDIDGSPSEGHTILRQLLAKQFAVILGFLNERLCHHSCSSPEIWFSGTS